MSPLPVPTTLVALPLLPVEKTSVSASACGLNESTAANPRSGVAAVPLSKPG